MRNKIILDELDIKILNVLHRDNNVDEILLGLNINHSTWLYHRNRLTRLRLITKESKGTYRIFKLTSKGENLIKWING